MPYDELLDGDFLHADDIRDAGPAINAVRYITIDKESAYQRNIGYIQESIALRKKREAGQ